MNLEQLYNNYSVPSANIQFLSQTKIALLVGITGAGKDTIQKELIKRPNYYNIVTHTTREPRENNGILEQNGREYHFVSRAEMAQLLANNEMIEINKFGENYYGTSIAEFQKAYEESKIAVSDIDVNGIAAFRELTGDVAHALFIVPPTYEAWCERISKRYSTEEEIAREMPTRRAIALSELEHVLGLPYYHFIINDQLTRAVEAIDDIVHRPDTFVRQDDEARLAARDLLDEMSKHS